MDLYLKHDHFFLSAFIIKHNFWCSELYTVHFLAFSVHFRSLQRTEATVFHRRELFPPVENTPELFKMPCLRFRLFFSQCWPRD